MHALAKVCVLSVKMLMVDAANMAICDGKLLDELDSRLVPQHLGSNCKAGRWLQNN